MSGEPETIHGQRIFTPELIRDPYPIYARLRDEAPLFIEPTTGERILTRYADVVAALKHPRLSSHGVAGSGLPFPAVFRPLMRPVTRTLNRQMLFSDPPDHTRLRALANRAFTPRVVEPMRPRVQQIADDLLDRIDPERGLSARGEPDHLDLRREDNRHLAFSLGIHFCLGAALARLEGQIAIGTILRRFPDLRLAGGPVEWKDNFTLRGLKALPVDLR